MIPIPFKRKRKEYIDIDSIDLHIDMDSVRTVCGYIEKRAEIALALSCLCIRNKKEYNVDRDVTPTYWLLLADEYLEKVGIRSAIVNSVPETVDDVFHKAKLVGLCNALEGLTYSIEEEVFERMAMVISNMICEEDIREEMRRASRRRAK